MIMSVVREAWSEVLQRLGKMRWLLISRELAHKNMRLITELESLELLAYWVGTWILGMNNLRSKEFTISIRMLVWTE